MKLVTILTLLAVLTTTSAFAVVVRANGGTVTRARVYPARVVAHPAAKKAAVVCRSGYYGYYNSKGVFVRTGGAC